MYHDPSDLGLICLEKKHKICFRILLDLRIQSWIFLKKCTLSHGHKCLPCVLWWIAGKNNTKKIDPLSPLFAFYCV